MAYDPVYRELSLTRDELSANKGPTLVEFGANWCGICRAFAPEMEKLLNEFPEVRHIKVEDGPGKPLGRSFRVKLWPTLVFLREGEVRGQVSRPSAAEARRGLESIASGGNK